MKKFMLSDDISDFYCEEGYVVLADAFQQQEIEQARADILDLFESRFRSVNKTEKRGVELLTHHYDQDKELWRECAKRMYDVLSIFRLAGKPEVAELLQKLGLQKPMISTRPEVRTDMPNDNQFMQFWHQDWRSGQGSLNSVTIWVPLHKVGVENGTIDIIPRSHVLGYLDCDEIPVRRFSIPEARLKGMPYFPVELEQGEAVVFSQMLVHRSGYNRSALPRLTTQLRFVDLADQKFLTNGLTYPTGSEMRWRIQPDANDMITVFRRAG